jgi:5'-3' exonuclease
MEQVILCSPDKDLAQMVEADRVVALDRRRDLVLDRDGVEQKFGVAPESIPDYLALVGDAADGIPGVPRWGAKSTALVLARYGHIEAIPADPKLWDIKVRGAAGISSSLAEHYDDALLYRMLATLRLDVPLAETLEELEWRGARKAEYQALCDELGFARLAGLPHKWIDA